MKLNNLKAIIFDVHKTLVDDSGFPREKIWKLLRQSGVKFSMEEYYHLYDYLTKMLFNWDKINPFIKIREIHKQRLITFYQKYDVTRNVDQDVIYLWRSMGESAIYPEVPEVLQKYQTRLKIGLLSNADNDDPLIELLLKKGFIFDTIITSESVKTYKPKPIIFQKILDELGCEKHQVVMVGDSPLSDVYGAKNFGIKVVWLNRTQDTLHNNCPEPDFQVSDLRQLFDILEV